MELPTNTDKIKLKELKRKLELPTNTDKIKLKELKRKLEVARSYKKTTCNSSTTRKEPTPRSTSTTPKKYKHTLPKNTSKHTNKYLQEQLGKANKKIKRLSAENKASQIKINYLKMFPSSR